MFKPRFTIRVFMLVAVFFGSVVAPWGYRRYLEWRTHDVVIAIQYTDVQEVAHVLRELYTDRNGSLAPDVAFEADARTNTLRVFADDEKRLNEIRSLVSEIDSANTGGSQVVGGPIALPLDNLQLDESLRPILREDFK